MYRSLQLFVVCHAILPYLDSASAKNGNLVKKAPVAFDSVIQIQ